MSSKRADRARGRLSRFWVTFAPIVGNILAGVLSDALGGLRYVFLITCFMLAVLCIVYFFLFRKQRKIDEETGFWNNRIQI